MSEIGARSGKIKPGVYRCGNLVIAKAKTGWWWVYKYYGTDHEQVIHHHPFDTQREAYLWANRQPQT